MRAFLLTSVCFFFVFFSFSQTHSGKLVDKDNGQPVPFVNIGILGKNIGTVSDAEGWFQMELSSALDSDTLLMSCIGYEHKAYLVRDFKAGIGNAGDARIELVPKAYQLDEVTIEPTDAKAYTLGNYCDPNSAYGNAFYSNELGTEIGVLIELPRKREKAYLSSLRFYVGRFTFDRFPVRLNIYNLKNGQPHENILTEPIFIEITSAGEYIVDLRKYSIITDEDFFISLEYYRIPDRTEGELVFCAFHRRKKKERNGFYRLASQGDWILEYTDNLGLSVEVECE